MVHRVWEGTAIIRLMSDRLEEMPLFPLNTVLFPHAQVQLHIFEDRYREMIAYCTETDQPFGVCLIRTGEEVTGQAEPYMVGTAGRILSVHKFEDGKMDVRVQGERRFRVRRLEENRPSATKRTGSPSIEATDDDHAVYRGVCRHLEEASETGKSNLF